jgi:hypothetical protein
MTDLAYILAASHSGSTLLAMLLGAHPEVVTTGELAPSGIDDLATYRCSCRALLRDCPFWARVAGEMASRGADFELIDFHTWFGHTSSRVVNRLLRPLHRGRGFEAVRDLGLWLCPTWRTEYPRLRRNNLALVEVLAATSGAQVVVDSSKRAVRLKYLLRIPGLRVRVIRMIRDGRAVALTYTDPANFADAQDPSLRGGGSGQDRDGERLSIAAAAREWRRSNEEAECILAGFDRTRWLEVRYEDLCANPDRTLRRVFAFLGVDPGRGTSDFRSVEHHVIGNGMRLDSTSEIRVDERWRAILKDGRLSEFDRVAGWLNRRYGYA